MWEVLRVCLLPLLLLLLLLSPEFLLVQCSIRTLHTLRVLVHNAATALQHFQEPAILPPTVGLHPLLQPTALQPMQPPCLQYISSGIKRDYSANTFHFGHFTFYCLALLSVVSISLKQASHVYQLREPWRRTPQGP